MLINFDTPTFWFSHFCINVFLLSIHLYIVFSNQGKETFMCKNDFRYVSVYLILVQNYTKMKHLAMFTTFDAI